MNGRRSRSPQAIPIPVDHGTELCRAGLWSHSILCLFHRSELAAFLLFYRVHHAGLAIGQQVGTTWVEGR